jgi:hypothetical protein
MEKLPARQFDHAAIEVLDFRDRNDAQGPVVSGHSAIARA